MDDIQRYDFWHREMEEYLANLKKEEEENKKPIDEDEDEDGTSEYNDGI